MLFGAIFNLSNSIQMIPVDVISSNSIDVRSEVTENAIETGGFVTDHVVLKPKEFTVNAAIGSISNWKPTVIYHLLDKARKYRIPLPAVIGLDYIPKTLITSLRFVQDTKTGDGILITASLREVNFVSGLQVAVTSSQGSSPQVNSRAASQVNRGTLETVAVDTGGSANLGSGATVTSSNSVASSVTNDAAVRKSKAAAGLDAVGGWLNKK